LEDRGGAFLRTIFDSCGADAANSSKEISSFANCSRSACNRDEDDDEDLVTSTAAGGADENNLLEGPAIVRLCTFDAIQRSIILVMVLL
jgi:hypothetical protein